MQMPWHQGQGHDLGDPLSRYQKPQDGKLAGHVRARVCVDAECILVVGEADDVLPVSMTLGVGMLGLDGDVG